MPFKIINPLILLTIIISLTVLAFSQTSPPKTAPSDAGGWKKLTTEPFRGKQDDVFFATPDVGWYVNGSGKIYKTIDGGASWVLKLNKPETYFRAIGFVDEQRGFAGNIGTEYYPNVSDTMPLYETSDGGETWKPVAGVTEQMIKGICAIEIVKKPFINAGKLDYKTTIFAGGRVGSPAFLLKSEDNGTTWQSIDMSRYCKMILDVKFFDEKNGVISAGTDADVQKSNALILTTDDGGKTWTKRYQSNRPYELTWKSSFPTRRVGYITVQNYNPDKNVTERVVAKTTDGGKTWKEILLANDFNLREFGIGFIDEKRGWVGGSTSGYETTDGGKT